MTVYQGTRKPVPSFVRLLWRAGVVYVVFNAPASKWDETGKKRWRSSAVAMQSLACFSVRTHPGVRAAASTTAVEPDSTRTIGTFDAPCRVELRTGKGCALGIARYPNFVYNAEGGGGSGRVLGEDEAGRLQVEFDAGAINIPDVAFGTTTLLGLPLPPPIRIQVVPQTLAGWIERSTGKVELKFQSSFYFSIGSLYQPPPLLVDTVLTTEVARGKQRRGQGSRLDDQGRCRLAGVARLIPINDWFMDNFLTLPTDCLAEMNAQFSFDD